MNDRYFRKKTDRNLTLEADVCCTAAGVGIGQDTQHSSQALIWIRAARIAAPLSSLMAAGGPQMLARCGCSSPSCTVLRNAADVRVCSCFTQFSAAWARV